MSGNQNAENITITDYSEKAIVVRGETREYRDALSSIGGKWNNNLRDGAGWIFPKTKRQEIERILSRSVNIISSNQEPEQKNHRSNQESEQPQKVSIRNETGMIPQLMTTIDRLNAKVDRLETLILKLLESSGISEPAAVVFIDDEEEEIAPKRLLRK